MDAMTKKNKRGGTIEQKHGLVFTKFLWFKKEIIRNQNLSDQSNRNQLIIGV